MSTSNFVTYSSLCNTADTETYLTEIQIQTMINLCYLTIRPM